MADLDHKHDEFAVLDIADDAVVANTVTPELTQLRALQAICDLSGIIEPGHALFWEFPDALARNRVQFSSDFRTGWRYSIVQAMPEFFRTHNAVFTALNGLHRRFCGGDILEVLQMSLQRHRRVVIRIEPMKVSIPGNNPIQIIRNLDGNAFVHRSNLWFRVQTYHRTRPFSSIRPRARLPSPLPPNP
jgi:hypothetical protein